MKRILFFLLVAGLLSSCKYLPEQFRRNKQVVEAPIKLPKIAGTWKLLNLEARDMAGKVYYPYDEKVQGMALFNDSTHFSIQYYDATRPALSQQDPFYCTDPEIRIAFLSGSAFYGYYEEYPDTLELKIITGFNPNLQLRKRKYSIQFKGDTLLMQAPIRRWNGVLLSEHSIWLRE